MHVDLNHKTVDGNACVSLALSFLSAPLPRVLERLGKQRRVRVRA